jgi:prenyltransferase beta subunit
LGGQDAHPTRKSTLCGTGILPVLDNNDATSQIDRTIIISFTKINIAGSPAHPTRNSTLCGTGILPVLDNNDATSQIDRTIIISFTKINIAALC